MMVAVNGTQLHYEVSGSGPALIMLHGNGEDMSIFDRAEFYLRQVFTVYLVDSRGHGQSAPCREYHYDDMVEDIARFITKLGIDRPVLYGFSDGGIVALLLAARHPGLVSRLVVSGPNSCPEGLSDLELRKIRREAKTDPKARMMLDEPHITASDLAMINVPVMVTAGSRDCIKDSDLQFIVNSIPDSTFCVMKRADHSSYIVHSTRIVDAILAATGHLESTSQRSILHR